MSPQSVKLAEFYLQQISAGIGLVILLFLLAYHSHQQCNNKNTKCTFYPPSLLTCSVLLMIMGIIFCAGGLSEPITVTHISLSETICYAHFLLLLLSYSLFKLILYIALCRRIVEAFGESHSVYSPKFLLIYQIMLILITFMLIILAIIFIKPGIHEGSIVPCQLDVFPDILLISIILFDFVVCGINLFLFLKPIYKLAHLSKESPNKRLQKRWIRLVKKTALLASISISTSFITWIFIAILSMATFFQVVDIVVTTISINLLFQKNEKIFLKICCCCCYYFKRNLYVEQDTTTSRTSTSGISAISPTSATSTHAHQSLNTPVALSSNTKASSVSMDVSMDAI